MERKATAAADPPNRGLHDDRVRDDPVREESLRDDPVREQPSGDAPEWDPGLGAGWDVPGRDEPPPRRRGRFELSSLFVLLASVRRAVPRELDEQLTTLIREFLLTLRSLIDWYLDRLDGSRREPEVEDIPID